VPCALEQLCARAAACLTARWVDGLARAQVLAHKGYIDIKWKRIREDVLYLVDTDGDGELTRKDVLKHVRGLLNVLVYKLPSTSGFTVGLVYGFRWS